jgi:hypothetical protein
MQLIERKMSPENREVWYLTTKIELLERIVSSDETHCINNMLKSVFPDAETELVGLRERLAVAQSRVKKIGTAV